MRRALAISILVLFSFSLTFGSPQDSVKTANPQNSDSFNAGDSLTAARPDSAIDSTVAAEKLENPFVSPVSENANQVTEKADPQAMLDFKVIKEINVITLLEALILLFSGFVIAKILDFIGKILTKKRFKSVARGILIALKITLWVILFYLIVSLFVKNADELLLLLFVAFLLIAGFAAVPVIRNLIGGFYISLGRPFEKGDNISILEFKGEVQKSGWRSTTIMTEDKSIITLPNSLFLNNAVENVNVGQREQLVTLEYEFPIEHDEKVMINMIKDSALASPYLFINKEVNVFLDKTDYVRKTNIFKVNLYIYDAKYESEMLHSINSAILRASKNKLESNGNSK